MVDKELSIDLSAKVIVVTGANSGIGFEACKYFASAGATLAMVCRSEEKGKSALKSLKALSGSDSIRLFISDFSSLDSVARVAKELLVAYPAIDVLCNNAGGSNGKRVVTSEGFETTLVVNHLSGFLLTTLLMPAILEAAKGEPARVVFTSSLGHKNSPIDFDDLNLEKDYGSLKAYGRSKLMNLLTARSLDQKHREDNVIVSSFHPGAVRTAIWGKGGTLAKVIGFVMYPFMWNIGKGTDTFIWLASSNDEAVQKANGKYFFDRQSPKIADFATDAAADQLWQKSEELVSPWLAG
ncbi:MAG: NAD(P)-dependent dehydrogenase (short-subunit alcohol dehydrogenase family) [Pseudohongiellaceae bacterium]|jgi:NAD(P)-dependent dehydrogenase (short-subunit alcohol dehydrogenase family)